MDLSKISGMAEAPAVVLATELDYRSAWERVLEKAGMPGVDGVTTSRFKRLADGALKGLESNLASGVYRPLPLRMAQLEKKAGGALRLLLVPSIVDRVAQSAVPSGWVRNGIPSSTGRVMHIGRYRCP